MNVTTVEETIVRPGWLETKLMKFAWYRKWRAYRSRKRLEKESIFKDVKGVEDYTPSPAIQERIKREDALRRARQKANAAFDCKVIQIWEDMVKEAGKHPREMTQDERVDFYRKYDVAVANYEASLET